ncbi:hypothetical protein AVEN_146788-1 [Araneus ventricosus]|uniref:Uncharacterized protein n=1 Tax=Araneus ventricosus TaxID=182803 RepID=A0A4Y2D9D3_ARAVE|nr:hypothetical protein AVEN_146788-1 [Araneus ventricosus]
MVTAEMKVPKTDSISDLFRRNKSVAKLEKCRRLPMLETITKPRHVQCHAIKERTPDPILGSLLIPSPLYSMNWVVLIPQLKCSPPMCQDKKVLGITAPRLHPITAR